MVSASASSSLCQCADDIFKQLSALVNIVVRENCSSLHCNLAERPGSPARPFGADTKLLGRVSSLTL
jgi:hypothetical protein